MENAANTDWRTKLKLGLAFFLKNILPYLLAAGAGAGGNEMAQ